MLEPIIEVWSWVWSWLVWTLPYLVSAGIGGFILNRIAPRWDKRTRLEITFSVDRPASSNSDEFAELLYRVANRSQSPIVILEAYIEFGDGKKFPNASGPTNLVKVPSGVPVYFGYTISILAQWLKRAGYSDPARVEFVVRLDTEAQHSQPIVVRGLDEWSDIQPDKPESGPDPVDPRRWYTRWFQR